MITRSVMVQTLCVPCSCHCRYCLLSWDHKPVGAEYNRSKEYAVKFYQYLQKNRPEISFNFTFGYCMDHPDLMAELDFLNSIGSVQGRFLQLDGMKMRSPSEIDGFMEDLKKHGVQHTNFTFYGTQSYHDRFAGRKGDFAYLLRLAESAMNHGIETSTGIPLNEENVSQSEELIGLLEERKVGRISLFVPHEEGRGIQLAPIRFSVKDEEKLGPRGKALFNHKVFQTEEEWVGNPSTEMEKYRSLLLSLTPENIEQFEHMDFETAIHYLEELDDRYYNALPSFEALAAMYGNPQGIGYYSKRDLYQHYQKGYIKEHKLDIYDVTDERFCGSRRY